MILTRRTLLSTAAAGAFLATLPYRARAEGSAPFLNEARAALAEAVTVDLHSHAGSVLPGRRDAAERPFSPLAKPMQEGLLAVACLAVVADSPAIRVTADRRIEPYRTPDAGELVAHGARSFARAHALIARDGMQVIESADALRAARASKPGVIVTSEGADFLEGSIARLDEAQARWKLRQLQLTHYRVNELGDIQTEAPVHEGLTEFGAAVVRRCNALGIVIDVAHGPFNLVKRVAEISTKPLVLSHTSLSRSPGPRSRLISPDHARLVAGTGGVIGIWPPSAIFSDMTALAEGMARMVDVAGVDHVGLGTDMQGLTGGSSVPDYTVLPYLAAALLARGFKADEMLKLMGGNYVRVFAAVVS